MRISKAKREEMRKDEKRLARQKAVKDTFLQLSRYVRPWLIELADKYKQRGEFPIIPVTLLPPYYKDVMDKEIAAYVCLPNRDVYGHFDRVLKLRELMGEHPWEWFRRRDWIALASNDEYYHLIGGIRRQTLVKVLDNLWTECFDGEEKRGCVLDALKGYAERESCSLQTALSFLTDDRHNEFIEQIRLFMVVLATNDGFGQGAWDEPIDVPCPVSHDIRQFMKIWFPEYRKLPTFDDAVRAFGFGKESDFFYAYLGWKELQKRNLIRCVSLADRYQVWYDRIDERRPSEWNRLLFPIEFE